MDVSATGLESSGSSLLARRDVNLQTKTEQHTEDAARSIKAKIEQHVRIRIRQDEDGDVELRLRAQLKGEFSSVIRSADQEKISESVLKISQSVRARIDIDVADDADPDQVRSALSDLVERFSTLVDSLASAVREGTIPSPLALVRDVRDAFDSLTDGLTEAFAPAIAAPAPVPAPSAPAPVAPAPAPTASPVDVEVEPSETAPPASERLISLRADLRARFSMDFRALLDRLARREPENAREHREREDEDHDEHMRHPAEVLRARFDLRQKLTFQLLDTRA